MPFQVESDSFGIVDSFPLPICKFARVPFHRTFLSDGVSLDATYGYCASKKETLAKEGIALLALPRSNRKEPFPSSIRKMIVKQRRKIETVFSQLNDQFHIEHVLAKNFYGLCSRLVTKIFGYNLCLLLNSIFSATAEICKIKQLIY